jgi:hypothetical protein
LFCEHAEVILRGKAEILKAEIGNQDGGWDSIKMGFDGVSPHRQWA